jgi:hypothetical protein
VTLIDVLEGPEMHKNLACIRHLIVYQSYSTLQVIIVFIMLLVRDHHLSEPSVSFDLFLFSIFPAIKFVGAFNGMRYDLRHFVCNLLNTIVDHIPKWKPLSIVDHIPKWKPLSDVISYRIRGCEIARDDLFSDDFDLKTNTLHGE